MALSFEVTATMLTPIDEPERGWCEPCGLPSLLSWWVTFTSGGRMLNDSLTRIAVCTDCGDETTG